MPGALNDPQLGRAVRVGNDARIDERHKLVVLAMHDQKLSGCKFARRDLCLNRRQVAGPGIEVFGEGRVADGTDLAGVGQQAFGVSRPV